MHRKHVVDESLKEIRLKLSHTIESNRELNLYNRRESSESIHFYRGQCSGLNATKNIQRKGVCVCVCVGR